MQFKTIPVAVAALMLAGMLSDKTTLRAEVAAAQAEAAARRAEAAATRVEAAAQRAEAAGERAERVFAKQVVK